MIPTLDALQVALRARSAPFVWVFHDVTDAAWFVRCIDAIQATHSIMPLDELVHGRARLRRACAITFDDGLKSTLCVADPILSGRGIPYTVFVCTEAVNGGPVPWSLRAANVLEKVGVRAFSEQWKLIRALTSRQSMVALKQVALPTILEGLDDLEARYSLSPMEPSRLFLTSAQVRLLADRGVEIGAHTHRHAILALLDAEEQQREIETNLENLATMVGKRPRQFAYPNGSPLDFNDVTRAILRRNGCKLAVTTTQRYVARGDDVFAIPRFGVADRQKPSRMAAKHMVPWISRSHAREKTLRKRVSGERGGV